MKLGRREQRWRRPDRMRVTPTPAGWQAHEKPQYSRPVRCWLYVLLGWDPHDGYRTETVIYIGESVHPEQRLAEHLELSVFGDTATRMVVAGGNVGDPPYVLDVVVGLPPIPEWVVWIVENMVADCKTDIWQLEERQVVRYRPPYNYEYNQNNPYRISIPDQRVARAARDAARRLPLEQTWAYLDRQRRTTEVAEVDGRWWNPWTWPARWRRMSRRTRLAVQVVTWWAVGTGVLWAVIAVLAGGAGWRVGVLAGSLVGLVMCSGRWKTQLGRATAGAAAIGFIAIGGLMLLSLLQDLVAWLLFHR